MNERPTLTWSVAGEELEAVLPRFIRELAAVVDWIDARTKPRHPCGCECTCDEPWEARS